MSEWSPGGNYSCPGTPNQTGRTYKCHWDEPERGTKSPPLNVRVLPENRNKNFQQHSMEDVSKTSSVTTSKSKKGGSGTSDPRFKRVISAGVQNDACVGTDVKSSKPSLVSKEKSTPISKLSVRNIREFKPNQTSASSGKALEESKISQSIICEQQDCEKLTATENSNFDQSNEHLKAVDKLSFNHDLVVKSLLKESVSDCTVNSRNTSLVSEEFTEELTNDLRRVPSASRVKKVQNWIHDQTPKIDKKLSVITVIGQMQGPDTLSSALQEIDKRRKLVKELDRYAVCKKIAESDKENDSYDLMGNINCLQTAERVLFPDSNETLITCFPGTKDSENKFKKPSDMSNNENNSTNSKEVNSDPIIPLPVSRKSSSVKKKMKCPSGFESPIKAGVQRNPECRVPNTKLVLAFGLLILFVLMLTRSFTVSLGKLREFFSSAHYQKMFCIFVLISGILCWFAFYSVQSSCVSFDLFTPKPKPLTWYEKICQWIWEFFRPSANYQRTTPWRSY